jgi:hypothetical protein
MIEVPKMVPRGQSSQPATVPCWESYYAALSKPPKILVWCGRGHISSIDNHTVSADGTVAPSLVCDRDGCAWHETVRLLNWTPRIPGS